MGKNSIKLIFVFSLLIILIAVSTVYFFVTRPIENTELNNILETESETESAAAENDNNVNLTDELPDYETLYLEYIKENVEYFSRGMILCDLNEDSMPYVRL